MFASIQFMFASIQEVKQAVEDNENILTVTMESLRNAYGAGKIGKHVLNGITKELAGQGLAHLPSDLPNYQHEAVRVYKLGTRVADIIDAVFYVGEENDDLLRQAVAGDEAILLKRVRELVCG